MTNFLIPISTYFQTKINLVCELLFTKLDALNKFEYKKELKRTNFHFFTFLLHARDLLKGSENFYEKKCQIFPLLLITD